MEIELPMPLSVQLTDGNLVLVYTFILGEILVGDFISDFRCLVMGQDSDFYVILRVSVSAMLSGQKPWLRYLDQSPC